MPSKTSALAVLPSHAMQVLLPVPDLRSASCMYTAAKQAGSRHACRRGKHSLQQSSCPLPVPTHDGNVGCRDKQAGRQRHGRRPAWLRWVLLLADERSVAGCRNSITTCNCGKLSADSRKPLQLESMQKRIVTRKACCCHTSFAPGSSCEVCIIQAWHDPSAPVVTAGRNGSSQADQTPSGPAPLMLLSAVSPARQHSMREAARMPRSEASVVHYLSSAACLLLSPWLHPCSAMVQAADPASCKVAL